MEKKAFIEVDLPASCDGFRVIGIGRPRVGEWYFSMQCGGPFQSKHNSEYYAVLLEQVEKWRPVDMSDLHDCLTKGPVRCQAASDGRVVQGELHTARRLDDGQYLFYVKTGDNFGWWSKVEVCEHD